jgi:hypothetical protein
MVPGMIDKDYFKRQAKTLRKMVKVAQDLTVAERLSEMADEFDAKASDGSGAGDRRIVVMRGASGDEGHG